MSKERRELQWNILIGILNQVLALVINLISKKAIQSYLGIEYLGLQSLFGNFCDILAFAFASTGTAMLFRLYQPLSESNREKLAAIYAYFDKLYRRITVLAGALGVGAVILVVLVVKADIGTFEVVGTYFLYLASIIVYNRFFAQHYFIMADQKRYVVCLVNSTVDFLALALQIAILYFTHSYGLFLVCILSKNLLTNGILALYRKKKYPYLKGKQAPLEDSEKKDIRENVRDTVTYRIGKVLLDSTDSILISGLVNTAIAGCYSNYLFISTGVQGLVNSFFDSVVARVGQNICKDPLEKQYRDFKTLSFINICIMGLCASGVYWLAQDFITLWMGPNVLLPAGVVTVVTVNLYLAGIRQTSNIYRQAAGIFHWIGQVVILRGVLNLILSLLLGLRFGLMGILISTTISNVLTVYWFEPYLLYRYFKKSFAGELLFQAAGCAVTLATIWLSGLAVSWISQVSWLSLLLKGGLVAAVCAGWLGLLSVLFFQLIPRWRTRKSEGAQDNKEDT